MYDHYNPISKQIGTAEVSCGFYELVFLRRIFLYFFTKIFVEDNITTFLRLDIVLVFLSSPQYGLFNY